MITLFHALQSNVISILSMLVIGLGLATLGLALVIVGLCIREYRRFSGYAGSPAQQADRHEDAPVSDGFTDQRDEDQADQEYCDRAAGRV